MNGQKAHERNEVIDTLKRLGFSKIFTTYYIYEKSLNCTLKIGEFMYSGYSSLI